MAQTMVGRYDHLSQARAAVHNLSEHGYNHEQISLVANAADESYSHYFDTEGRYQSVADTDTMTTGEGAAAGAGIGATVGGLGGLLMGLGLLAVPGVGPALAAGPIVSALVGAGIGAASGGVAGALANAGVPEEHAPYYAEGVRRGGSLVMVAVEPAQMVDAEIVLNRHHPVNIEERVRDWRELGFEAYDPEADAYSSDQIASERAGYTFNPVHRDMSESYHAHYKETYAEAGRAYVGYEPAYLLGSGLAYDPMFANRSWNEAEREIEQRWLERGSRAWADYREAVRYGYEQERNHA